MAKFLPLAKDIRVNRLKKIFGIIDYVIDLKIDLIDGQGQGQGQTLQILKSNISKTVGDREKVLIEVR